MVRFTGLTPRLWGLGPLGGWSAKPTCSTVAASHTFVGHRLMRLQCPLTMPERLTDKTKAMTTSLSLINCLKLLSRAKTKVDQRNVMGISLEWSQPRLVATDRWNAAQATGWVCHFSKAWRSNQGKNNWIQQRSLMASSPSIMNQCTLGWLN